MNIIIDIGIYMLASSTIMVGYFWFKDIKHSKSGYEQMLENQVNEQPQSAKENIAA